MLPVPVSVQVGYVYTFIHAEHSGDVLKAAEWVKARLQAIGFEACLPIIILFLGQHKHSFNIGEARLGFTPMTFVLLAFCLITIRQRAPQEP